MRSRSDVVASPINTIQSVDRRYHNNGSGGEILDYTNYANNSQQDYQKRRWIDDIVIEGYRRKSKNGEVFFNPLHQLSITNGGNVAEFDVFFENRANPDPKKWDHRWRSHDRLAAEAILQLEAEIPDYSSERQKCYDMAVTDAWANVSFSEANVWVTLGELGETISLIHDLFKRIKKFYKKWNHWNNAVFYDYAWKVAKGFDVPKAYMEFRYGLRPLYFEMKQYISVLKKLLSDDLVLPRFTFRGFREYYDEFSETKEITLVNQSNKHLTVNYFGQVEIQARAGVMTSLEDISLPMLLGLNEPIEAAYDLIPYSFILSWFINIANIIGSWTPNCGFETLGSWVTMRETYTFTAVGLSSRIDGTGRPLDIRQWKLVSEPKAFKVTQVKDRFIDPKRSVLPRVSLHLDRFKFLDIAVILAGYLPKFK